MQALWQNSCPESNTLLVSRNLPLRRFERLSSKPTWLMPWKDNFGVPAWTTTLARSGTSTPAYRYYQMERATLNQVDIGGFFAGGHTGQPASVSSRPQVPWYLTTGLTTNISSNLTNSFHYSYLRNYWARASAAEPPQVDGLGRRDRTLWRTSANVLAPFNLDTQSVRTRFWDGKDNMFATTFRGPREPLLPVWRNLPAQLGLSQRTDNGGGINYNDVYQTGAGGLLNGMDMTGFIPAAITTTATGFRYLPRGHAKIRIVLGVPGITQIAYTRTGSD